MLRPALQAPCEETEMEIVLAELVAAGGAIAVVMLVQRPRTAGAAVPAPPGAAERAPVAQRGPPPGPAGPPVPAQPRRAERAPVAQMAPVAPAPAGAEPAPVPVAR